MFKKFERRRDEILADSKPPQIWSAAEFVKKAFDPTSEDRLLALEPSRWSPKSFQVAARDLRRAAGLEVLILNEGQTIPPLSSDTSYDYAIEYSEVFERISSGENLIAGVVMEEQRVIAYAIASQQSADVEIEIIDVDQFSRRSAGLQNQIEFNGYTFGIGIGHVLVDALVEALTKPIFVDATNEASRYIFRSLGFKGRDVSNPCLLRHDYSP